MRTARAKGLSELIVFIRHVLRNAMIPILTGVVVVIPLPVSYTHLDVYKRQGHNCSLVFKNAVPCSKKL